MNNYSNNYVLKHGEKLVLRTPEEKDAQSLIDLMKIVDTETKFLAREPGEFDFTLDQEKEFIKGLNNNINEFFLVGEIEGEIICTCNVGRVQIYKRYLHRAVMALLIKKNYWGKGIGKIMIQECINWCKEKGIEQLELEVVTENQRAISLYKGFGFEITGTVKNALKYSDGTYADEYTMCLFLKDFKAN